MEELRMEHRGKQTTDLPAMSAGAGIPSKPAERLGLKEARAFSHQEGVVGTRDRVDSVEGTEEGGEREALSQRKTCTLLSTLKYAPSCQEPSFSMISLSRFCQIMHRTYDMWCALYSIKLSASYHFMYPHLCSSIGHV